MEDSNSTGETETRNPIKIYY